MKIARFAAIALVAGTLALTGCKCADKAPAAAGMVNSKCPISGEPCSDSKVTCDFKGAQVGFCCSKCKAKFEAMTDADKQAAFSKVSGK